MSRFHEGMGGEVGRGCGGYTRENTNSDVLSSANGFILHVLFFLFSGYIYIVISVKFL